MSTSDDMAERHARDLARFQAIAMYAAETAPVAIEAAGAPGELCGLVSALNRAGRGLLRAVERPA